MTQTQLAPRGPFLACAAIALAAFAIVAVDVQIAGRAGWDRTVFRGLYAGATKGPPGAAPNDSPLLKTLLPALNRLSDVRALALLFAATAVGLCVGRRRRHAAFFLAAIAVTLSSAALKHAFASPLPFPSSEAGSFPSGHAMASMAAVAAIVVLLAPTRLRWPSVVGGAAFVAGVGVAVVADGGHWPSDVLAGWSLALAWVCLLGALFGLPAHRRPT